MDGVAITTNVQLSKVDATKWDEMNFNELLEQKSVMLDRYEYLVSIGSNFAAKQVVEGITTLDSFIAQKTLK